MKNLPVSVPETREIIYPTPGFQKKDLADWHAETGGLCAMGCSYCSSNSGNFLRIRREEFANLTEAQLGERLYPSTAPGLTFVWDNALDVLDRQLATKPATWGEDKVLMFSQLTDAFAPYTLTKGPTLGMLDRFLRKTRARIRILTKSALVARDDLIALYLAHPKRFVVGLSVGTLDDDWARRVEIGTSSPSARIEALHKLQDAGVPTFGMLCPIFPDVIADKVPAGRSLAALVKAIRPERCETVWAEPFNDRGNWQKVREGYVEGSAGWNEITAMFGAGGSPHWSAYATTLYTQLLALADRGGWADKLKYLLYEGDITAPDVGAFTGLRGVLLQSPPRVGPDGKTDDPLHRSGHPGFAALQDQAPPGAGLALSIQAKIRRAAERQAKQAEKATSAS